MTMTAPRPVRPARPAGFSGRAPDGRFCEGNPVTRDCPQCVDGGFVVPYRAEQGLVVELRCLRHNGNFPTSDRRA